MRGEEGVFKVLGSPRWERDTALSWWLEPRLDGPNTQPKQVIFAKKIYLTSKKILSGWGRQPAPFYAFRTRFYLSASRGARRHEGLRPAQAHHWKAFSELYAAL